MGVADFDHSELLQNAVVQLQLFFLENGNHLVAQVNRKQVAEHLTGQNLTVGALDFVRH